MSDYSFDGHSTDPPSRIDLAFDPSGPRSQARGPRPGEINSGDRMESPGVHLLDYVKVLYKRRWTAIMAFVLVLGTVTIDTFSATPIYQAKTRLLIETENPNVVSFKAVVEENQARLDYYLTQYNILQSRALARRTLDELQLWNTAPFGGAPRPPGLGRRCWRFPLVLGCSLLRPRIKRIPASEKSVMCSATRCG